MRAYHPLPSPLLTSLTLTRPDARPQVIKLAEIDGHECVKLSDEPTKVRKERKIAAALHGRLARGGGVFRPSVSDPPLTLLLFITSGLLHPPFSRPRIRARRPR